MGLQFPASNLGAAAMKWVRSVQTRLSALDKRYASLTNDTGQQLRSADNALQGQINLLTSGQNFSNRIIEPHWLSIDAAPRMFEGSAGHYGFYLFGNSDDLIQLPEGTVAVLWSIVGNLTYMSTGAGSDWNVTVEAYMVNGYPDNVYNVTTNSLYYYSGFGTLVGHNSHVATSGYVEFADTSGDTYNSFSIRVSAFPYGSGYASIDYALPMSVFYAFIKRPANVIPVSSDDDE